MRDPGLRHREEALDRWLDSDREPPEALAEPEADLARVALLVRRHVDEAPAVPPRARGGRPLVRAGRAAAVVLLVAGLAIGVAVGASRSGSRQPDVPLGALTEARMPSGLYEEIATQAGSAGDPYPPAPVLWVRTTASKIDRWLTPYHMPSQSRLPAGLTEWVAQATGRFYGFPSTRSSRFDSMLFAWVPFSWEVRRLSSPPRASAPGGETSGFPAVPLAVLEELGTVHREQLTRPRFASAAPGRYTGVPTALPPAVRTDLRFALVQFEPINGSLAVDWVGLTAGQLRAKVPWSPVPASLPANFSVLVVRISESGSAFGNEWWYFSAPRRIFEEASVQGSSGLLGIARLGQLGPVHHLRGLHSVVHVIGPPAKGCGASCGPAASGNGS